MVENRRVYDFCEHAEAQRQNAGSEGSSDFFIDGWDAYDRWLDSVRDEMDNGDDQPIPAKQ